MVPAGWWQESFDVAAKSANVISDVCSHIVSHGIILTHPFAGFAAVAAGTVHSHLKYWPQSSSTPIDATHYLNQDAEVLAALRNICATLIFVLCLQACVQRADALKCRRSDRLALVRQSGWSPVAVLQPRARRHRCRSLQGPSRRPATPSERQRRCRRTLAYNDERVSNSGPRSCERLKGHCRCVFRYKQSLCPDEEEARKGADEKRIVVFCGAVKGEFADNCADTEQSRQPFGAVNRDAGYRRYSYRSRRGIGLLFPHARRAKRRIPVPVRAGSRLCDACARILARRFRVRPTGFGFVVHGSSWWHTRRLEPRLRKLGVGRIRWTRRRRLARFYGRRTRRWNWDVGWHVLERPLSGGFYAWLYSRRTYSRLCIANL